jgi:hypothetical protein
MHRVGELNLQRVLGTNAKTANAEGARRREGGKVRLVNIHVFLKDAPFGVVCDRQPLHSLTS